MQIAPEAPAPELQERLLSACSTGLRARCVAAADHAADPVHAVAVVSWASETHVQIEVGLSDSEEAVWVARELDFTDSDPVIERWRSVGFTIAVLADDERLWSSGSSAPVAAAAPPPTAAPLQDTAAPVTSRRAGPQLDLRALGGTGLVGGALRVGAEARGWFAISDSLGLTSSASYGAASARALDVRWVDLSLGLGLEQRLWSDLGARLRLEALLENVSALAQRDGRSERRSVWVPGFILGSDLLWHVGERWALSVRFDGFWLDGATAIRSAGERLGASAGAGALLGVGAGYRF